MNPQRPSTPEEPGLPRRTFLQAGVTALALGGAGTLARPGTAVAAAAAGAAAQAAGSRVEWRNKQEGMAYRRLGRTGLMISEVVCGGDPITLENYKHLARAIEMGLNYLDMAPAYNKGDTERAYGKLLADSPGPAPEGLPHDQDQRLRPAPREDVPGDLRRPPRGQAGIAPRAGQGPAGRAAVEKPGYYLTYFPNQQRGFEGAYLRVAMMPEYGRRVEGSPELRRHFIESIEGSLKRVGTDHFDMSWPRTGRTPRRTSTPEIAETFAELKRQGKVRFLGVTSHNDPAGLLRAATAAGHYDADHDGLQRHQRGTLEEPIRQAAAKDVGVIAMKAAHAVATHHKSLQPIPTGGSPRSIGSSPAT